LRHAHLPVSTNHLFAYTGGADFALHNYAPLAGIVGAPLIGPLGVVGAFNALVLVFSSLSGISMFVLARRLGLGATMAWVAGALFMAAPALVARDTAHFSLMIAAPLPLFLWSLVRTLESSRIRDAVLVGMVVAAAYYSDAYYGIYCVIMGAFVIAWRHSQIEWPDVVDSSSRLKRLLTVVIALMVAVIGWRMVTGTRGFSIGPIRIGLETLYTPQLVLLVTTVMRLWLVRRPTVRLGVSSIRLKELLRLGLVAVAVCLLLLLPLLVGLAIRSTQGRLPETDTYWRSSPRGLDVFAYLVPNPNHAWFGEVTRFWFMPPKPDAFPEFVGAFSLIAFGIIAVGACLRLLPRLWLSFSAFFFALSLGPFVHVAGINTFVVGPWAFLRYVPVIGMARSPSRFGIVTILGMSLLTAFSLERMSRQGRIRGWLGAAVAIGLALELLPAPRVLFSAAVPNVYRQIALNGDEQGALLELPTGIRDGTSSIGNFSAASEYFQTAHRRRLVGGYLSRVSTWRKQEDNRSPMLRMLFALSEGRSPSQESIAAANEDRDSFLRRSCVKFVIVNKRHASRELQQIAINALRLTPSYEDAEHVLLSPDDPPACDPPLSLSALVHGR
jgi:hypothetical protein